MKRTINIKAATAAEASAIYCAKRDASGSIYRNFPNGKWNGLHISYNGRVWNEDGKAIYNPGGKTPDIWVPSTHPDVLAADFVDYA